MNIDIRNLEEKSTVIISRIKEDYRYINTNIDAAKLCIRNFPSLKKEVETLKEDNYLLDYKLKTLVDALKTLNINPDFDQMEKNYAEAKRRHNKHFSH
ncbi:hypothetical protein [Flagellimonas sp. CMM7]|uniref:hypothetical protein n=1 Tax=Flagellimonas sp. CMM7 TaxID=2654676 RepID=UPI0013D5E30C|nr:hypothetical protein [Flagellimonas sp. CMM7]UII79577.1 hypothetical protein LV704_18190 [Flagellimonas sp. CMM7]